MPKITEMNDAWSDIYDGGYTSVSIWINSQKLESAAETPRLNISFYITFFRSKQGPSQSGQEELKAVW